MDRETVAQFYVTKYKEFLISGMKPGLAYQNLLQLGYVKTHRCTRLQIKAVASSGKVYNRVSRACRKPKLNQTKSTVLRKWILHRNRDNEIVTRRNMVKYIQNKWDISLTTRSIGNFMVREKLSSRATSKAKGEANVSFEV